MRGVALAQILMAERARGSSCRLRAPHPALRATLSRRERDEGYVLILRRRTGCVGFVLRTPKHDARSYEARL